MRKDAFVWYQKMPSHHLSSVKEPKLYILNLLIQKLLTTTKLIHTFFKGYSTGSPQVAKIIRIKIILDNWKDHLFASSCIFNCLYKHKTQVFLPIFVKNTSLDGKAVMLLNKNFI